MSQQDCNMKMNGKKLTFEKIVKESPKFIYWGNAEIHLRQK